MKNNDFEQPGKNQDDKIGAILRAGLPRKQNEADAQAFTNRVMARIASLKTESSFPGFLWALPAVLAVLLLIVTVFGLAMEEKAEAPSVDNVLLAGMPTETQNMLSRSPSFSNLLWNPSQGGFLP